MPSAVAPSTSTFPPLRRGVFTTLQVNLGYRCNQACSHCHVDAGPHRRESMEADTLALIVPVLAARRLACLDLTGGAPELHPGFRDLVRQARALGVEVIDRCNLTILSEPGQEGLAAFLAAEGVRVVASLPCYLPDNVDRQRGRRVRPQHRRPSGAQPAGLRPERIPLQLDLVFNPQGPLLPPPQEQLEADYRRVLGRDHGVVFHRLLALANMPIQRFAHSLHASGQHASYLALLRQQHRPANLPQVMCRSLISVDWQGRLYDCDFNQQLGWTLEGPAHLRDLLAADPGAAPVRVGEHCFGCTAGAGSSCGGALS